MSLLETIPGYREAVESEASARSEAFTGAPEMVCGVELLPMTPRHLLLLQATRSPFVVGGAVSSRDVGLFLWCLSPDYAAALRARNALSPWAGRLALFLFRRVQTRFLRRVRRLDAAEAIEGCRRIVREALLDGPGSRRAGWSPEYFSPVASLVSNLAEKYGWSEAAIIDTPFKRLFQYTRVLRAASDPKAIFFNPSDSVRSAWLRERNARQ